MSQGIPITEAARQLGKAPSTLRRRIQEAVDLLIDVEWWRRNVRVEEAEFNSIREVVAKFKTGQVSI